MHFYYSTCVSIDGRGVLLRGFSGSGKSDLAIRLINDGAELVADDQVVFKKIGDNIWASPPPNIEGIIELRGIGLLRCDFVSRVQVALVVDLVSPIRIQRLPKSAVCEILGVEFPLIELAPFESSAPTKLSMACRAIAKQRKLGLIEDIF